MRSVGKGHIGGGVGFILTDRADRIAFQVAHGCRQRSVFQKLTNKRGFRNWVTDTTFPVASAVLRTLTELRR